MKTKSAKKRKGTRLGQHFLTAPWAAAKLAAEAGIRTNDTVLEIGPGRGALTKELLKTGARVVAIEKDERLAEELKQILSDEIAKNQLKIIVGDVRDFDAAQAGIHRYVLAANIPYYITGEILRQFLTAETKPRAMALLMQKEVAERILARPGRSGDKKESILSLSVKAYGTPRIAAKVGRGNFSPPPSVDSAILVIENISSAFFDTVDEQVFFDVVKAGFASKRKKLAGNLKKRFGERAASALTKANISPAARAEDVSLAEWKRIAEQYS